MWQSNGGANFHAVWEDSFWGEDMPFVLTDSRNLEQGEERMDRKGGLNG